MKSISEYPQGYSHLERAAGMMNALIDRGELPISWKVALPITDKTTSVFGIYDYSISQSMLLEGFMLGLAMASGTISIGKCREWMTAAGAAQPHELSNFGGAIRDMFAKEDEDVTLPKRRRKK